MNLIKILFFTFFIVNITNAQWTSSDLPYNQGVLVTSIVCTSDNVFASTYGESMYLKGYGTVFRSTDNGITWTISNNGLPIQDILGLVQNKNIIFANVSGYGLYRSTNNGDTWIESQNGFVKSMGIRSFCVYKDTLYAVGIDSSSYSSYGHIYKSTDNGISWNIITGLDVWYINSIAKNDDAIFLTTTFYGTWESSDNGSSWNKNSMWTLGDNFTYPILVKDHTVFVGGYEHLQLTHGSIYNKGIYRSNDNGINWTKSLDIRGHSFINVGNYILASGADRNEGIYLTNDGGNSWTSITANLSSEVWRSVLGANNNYIFVGGPCGNETRIWRRPQADITAIQDNLSAKNVVYSFCLNQNYPNPFNPTTIIEYEIPTVSRVRIEVFDVLGRNIKTLFNGEQTAGNYKINFDGSKLSNGIYFYKITAGSFVQTKKMVLTK